MRQFTVYILANRAQCLYVGVTSDLPRRLRQHVAGKGSRFAHRYHITRLVHVEQASSALEAIAREKEIKGWRRSKKVALVEATNPEWVDLASLVLERADVAGWQRDSSLRSE